ncbi:MAG: MFS transporter [Actinomycetota bacterium]
MSRGGKAGGFSLDGFKAVFKVRDFRLLFFGQAISALGDWVGTLAFIAAAEQLSKNAFAVPGVLALRLLPTLFATPLGGVFADRFDRKKIMILSDLIRFGIIVAVAFIPNLIALFTLAFAHECFSLIFLPARDASLPNIVPTERLEPANGLMMVSSFGGIPLAGPVYGAIAAIATHFPTSLPTEALWRPDHGGHAWALTFLFDSLTFLVSAACIYRMHLPEREHLESQAEEKMGAMLRAGARYVGNSRLLRGLAYAVSLGLLGGGVLFAKGISYVKDTLGGNDVAFGYLMGLFGGGMIIGFFISQLHGERGVFWTLRGSLLAMAGVLITMSIIPAIWVAYLMAAVFGASFSTAIIIGMTQAQVHSSDEMRGRVMAAVHILVNGALLLGALGAAGIGSIFRGGLKIPLLHYHADSNQVALALAGGLIALGVIGIRGAKPDLT